MLVYVEGCGPDSERTSSENSVEIVQDADEKGRNGEKQTESAGES